MRATTVPCPVFKPAGIPVICADLSSVVKKYFFARNKSNFQPYNYSSLTRFHLRSANYNPASQPEFENPKTPADLSRHSAAAANHTLHC
jgi:hypothetical protein